MAADPLLSRLEGVTASGTGRWRAVCPAHPSKHRSLTLAVTETNDGAVLLKCFAGCEVSAIVGAVGLALSDLFPPRMESHVHARPAERRAFWQAQREALQVLRGECLLVAMAAERLYAGHPLTHRDRDRLFDAAEKIREAVDSVS